MRLGLVIALASSGGGAAQPVSAGAHWQALWSSPYCTISTGDPKQLALSIWYVPGSSGVEIYFMGDPALIPQLGGPPRGPSFEALQRIADMDTANQATADMGAGRRPIPVTVLGGTPVLQLAMSGEDFFGNFGSSTEFVVRQGRKTVGLSYSRAGEALSALQQCIDARLKDWGVDSAALASLKRRPVLSPGSWTSYYPKEALLQKQAGTVVVRLVTDTSGKVTNCAVVLSSGVPALDNSTCPIALRSARYEPAIGADGRPAPATFTNYIKFDPSS